MRQVSVFLTGLFIVCLSTIAVASKPCSVEFFASNNISTIDLETAYQRLTGEAQHQLKDSMMAVLQKNHMEQGQFEDILGTYQMADNGSITADNTDAFITSPYQCLSEETAFSIAQQFANAMKQESVAVFIASSLPTIGELKISFTSHQLSIKEVVALIHDKLPLAYSQAFSLHLTNEHGSFENAKVAEIEWLGSKVNVNEVNQAFPEDKVTYQYGIAYLVYKNGQKEKL